MRRQPVSAGNPAKAPRDEPPDGGGESANPGTPGLHRGVELPTDGAPAFPFAVVPRAMGARPGIDIDDIGGLLEYLDGTAHP